MKKIVNLAVWSAVSLVMLFFIVQSKKLAVVYMIFVLVVLLMAIWIHYQKSKKDEKYLFNAIGFTQNSSRIVVYDYLRVIAMILVIVTHAIQPDLVANVFQGEGLIFLMKIIAALSMSCNTIYFMLSGALLLPYKKEFHLYDYYIKRVSTLVIPMVVYLVFYKWATHQLMNGNLSEIKEIMRALYYADFVESPNFWILPELLSFYIIVPFLRLMMKEMFYKWLTIMVGISFVWLSIPVVLKLSFGYGSFLSGWPAVAIMGYWLMREETRKYDKYIKLAGVAGFAGMMFLIKYSDNYLHLCSYLSPISISLTMAFICVLLNSKKFFTKSSPMLNLLAKYSFSVLLVHWWVLHYVVRGRFGLNSVMMNGLGMIISILATILISFLIAFGVDNTFVVVGKEVFEKAALGIKKLIKKRMSKSIS